MSSSQPTKPLTVAELLTDLSSLKACTPAEATALISTTSSTQRPSEDDSNDVDLNNAKELIALFNEVAERAGVDELVQVRESVERIEEGVRGRVES